jgi:hypothetical protein
MEYKNKRVGGFIVMVIGTVLGKIFIFDLLQAAKEGQEKVHVFRSGIVTSIACLLIGVLYIIFGDKAGEILKFDANNLKFQNVLILLVLAGVGLAGYVWVNMQLSALGYN